MAIKSTNRRSYNDIFSMLKDHNKWFSESIPLIASENVPSPAVREALISLYAEGLDVYAMHLYRKVEFECIKLAKKLFRAEFADVSYLAWLQIIAIYSGFTNPGDVMLTASRPSFFKVFTFCLVLSTSIVISCASNG